MVVGAHIIRFSSVILRIENECRWRRRVISRVLKRKSKSNDDDDDVQRQKKKNNKKKNTPEGTYVYLYIGSANNVSGLSGAICFVDG